MEQLQLEGVQVPMTYHRAISPGLHERHGRRRQVFFLLQQVVLEKFFKFLELQNAL